MKPSLDCESVGLLLEACGRGGDEDDEELIIMAVHMLLHLERQPSLAQAPQHRLRLGTALGHPLLV